MKIKFFVPFLVEGERPFIDREWSAVRQDHGEIIRQLSMEGDPTDIEEKSEGCHMEVISRR